MTKMLPRWLTALVLTGVVSALSMSIALELPAYAQKKKPAQKDKKDDKKDPPKEEKKEIPKDKTPPLLVIKGHKDWVNSVSYSPDGKFIVTASRDRTIKIWDAQSGKELKTLEKNPTNVRNATFTPDGKLVVSTTGEWNKKKKAWEGEIKFWDPETGKAIRSLTGHSDQIRAMAFNSDGSKLVTAGEDGTAVLWDVKEGKAIKTFSGHKEKILDVAITQDGSKIATCTAAEPGLPAADNKKKDKKDDKKAPPKDEPSIKIWDTGTGKELQTIRDSERDVTSVTFSPDGKTLAASNLDGEIVLYGMDGKKIREMKTPEGIWSITFSNDGKFLAATGWNDTIKLFDVASGKELFYRNGHERTVTTVTISPDGSRMVTAGIDQTIRIWEMPKN